MSARPITTQITLNNNRTINVVDIKEIQFLRF